MYDFVDDFTCSLCGKRCLGRLRLRHHYNNKFLLINLVITKQLIVFQNFSSVNKLLIAC